MRSDSIAESGPPIAVIAPNGSGLLDSATSVGLPEVRKDRLRKREQWSPMARGVVLVESAVSASVALVAWLAGNEPIALVAMIWLLVQSGSALVDWRNRRALPLLPTFRHAQVLVVGLLAALALTDMHDVWPSVAAFGLVVLSLSLRLAARAVGRRVQRSSRIVVVGPRRGLHAATHQLASKYSEVLAYDAEARAWHRAVVLPDSDEMILQPVQGRSVLAAGILEMAPERVVILSGALEASQIQELSWAVEPYDIDMVVEVNLQGVTSRRLDVVSDFDGTALRISPSTRRTAASWVRVVDAMFAAALLLLAAPLMLVIAVLIRATSPGPALFVQPRVGSGGSVFPMLKFRTMHVDAEQQRTQLAEENEVDGGVLFKMREDPRVTRVGRVLRAASLDELPQLVNVLMGQMSLIGPRPALPSEVAAYDDRTRRRLDVRPGLTGLWQVSGRSNLSWEESVRLDIDYVDNWSASRDVGIALRTVKVVATRDGAY